MLKNIQKQQGAHIAPDGIPLHYGNLEAEYAETQTGAALMDRSHEARIRITGGDRLSFLHNICTSELLHLPTGEGRGAVLTQANARIIDNMLVFNRGDEALLLTNPGRGQAILSFLQKKIFFNDDAQLTLLDGHQFVLHGPQAANVLAACGLENPEQPPLVCFEAEIAGLPVFVARRKPLCGEHWSVVTFDEDTAGAVWQALNQAGAKPAGAIAYNMLRIGAGAPAFGREITSDYLPLEVGLWDDISFQKGCYTGQEIIARMESRGQLARVMVRTSHDTELEAPQKLFGPDDKPAGTLTSAVTTASGQHLGVAVIKNALASQVATLHTPDGVQVRIEGLAGAAPPEHMLKGN